MKNAEKIILSIYEQYNPEKLSTVSALLEKYIGHEDDLLESIFTKYNISPEERDVFLRNAGEEKAEDTSSETHVTEPSLSYTETPVVQTPSIIKNPEKLILSIYERYNPEKLSTVPVLLEKYSGGEDDLVESIFAKYNISSEERDEFIRNAGQEKAADTSSEAHVTEPSLSYTEAPVVQAQQTIENPEKLILSIYERYNPEKLTTVLVLLEKYSGHEDDLVESIFVKYNISPEERDVFLQNAGEEKAADTSTGTHVAEPSLSYSEAPVVQAQQTIKNPEKLILSIYERYNPEKLTTVPVLLEKYSGREDDLVESIFAKYNISPEERDVLIRNAGQEKEEYVSLETQISEPAPTITETPIVQEQTVTETPYVSQYYASEPQVITPAVVETTPPSVTETHTQSSVTSPTVADTNETEIKDNPSPEPVKKKGISVLVWILISVFIIIILGSGTVALLQYNGNINIAFLNGIIPTKAKNEAPTTTSKQKKTTATNKKIAGKEKPQQTKKDSTTVAVSNNTPVLPVKNNTPVQPVKNNTAKQVNTTSNSGKNFFIIAGSYRTMQLAEDAVRILKSKGHEGAQVVDNNQDGNIRICYSAYATRQEAMQDLPNIQKNENTTAWIYKKK